MKQLRLRHSAGHCDLLEREQVPRMGHCPRNPFLDLRHLLDAQVMRACHRDPRTEKNARHRLCMLPRSRNDQPGYHHRQCLSNGRRNCRRLRFPGSGASRGAIASCWCSRRAGFSGDVGLQSKSPDNSMTFPHDSSFRFRRLLFLLSLGSTVAIFVVTANGPGTRRLVETAFLCVVVLAAYCVMRLFVAWVCKPLTPAFPKLVRTWGIAWFYGSVPATLLGLYVGSHMLGATPPTSAIVCLALAAALASSAGAMEAIHLSEGRFERRHA